MHPKMSLTLSTILGLMETSQSRKQQMYFEGRGLRLFLPLVGVLEAEKTGDGRKNEQVSLFGMEMTLNSIWAKHKCTVTKKNKNSQWQTK